MGLRRKKQEEPPVYGMLVKSREVLRRRIEASSTGTLVDLLDTVTLDIQRTLELAGRAQSLNEKVMYRDLFDQAVETAAVAHTELRKREGTLNAAEPHSAPRSLR